MGETMGDDSDTLVGSNKENSDLEISAEIKFEQKLSEEIDIEE